MITCSFCLRRQWLTWLVIFHFSSVHVYFILLFIIYLFIYLFFGGGGEGARWKCTLKYVPFASPRYFKSGEPLWDSIIFSTFPTLVSPLHVLARREFRERPTPRKIDWFSSFQAFYFFTMFLLYKIMVTPWWVTSQTGTVLDEILLKMLLQFASFLCSELA